MIFEEGEQAPDYGGMVSSDCFSGASGNFELAGESVQSIQAGFSVINELRKQPIHCRVSQHEITQIIQCPAVISVSGGIKDITAQFSSLVV